MKSAARASTLSVLIFAGTLLSPPGPLGAQDAVVFSKPALTSEQMEEFLLHARILTSRGVGKGITGSKVATLSDGRLTHDAHIQNVSIETMVFTPQTGPTELNFKDQYRYNIAAYRLSQLLGLHNVPVSVERRVDGHHAAVTWWIDDVLMDEKERLKRVREKNAPAGWPPAKVAGYIHVMRVFDELIANTDRNVGNQLWTSDGTLWLIDHTRAFRLRDELIKPGLLKRCDRALFRALQGLTIESVTAAVERSLTKDEIRAVVARRDLIVQRFEELIKAAGESAVLYTLQR
jgi:hypothetical protein